jgi:signal peptidase I
MIPIKEYDLLEATRYNLPLIQVPSGEYFSWEIIVAMITIISHIWGFLPVKNLIRCAVFRFFPLHRFSWFSDFCFPAISNTKINVKIS